MSESEPYLFDEAEYLRLNPDVAALVAAGHLERGLEHWRRHGRAERRPYWEHPPVSRDEFDECEYLLEHRDVRRAVLNGQFASGYDHWILDGYREQRAFKARGIRYGPASKGSDIREASYLSLNPHVADAVAKGAFRSGYDHWLRTGRSEGRFYFDCAPWPKATWSQALKNYERGVNYFGFPSEPTGLGSAARGYLGALEHLGIPTSPVHLQPWHHAPAQQINTSGARYAINFIHQNAEMMSSFVAGCGPDFLATRYNIGLWVWELHAGYAEWEDAASLLNEIWAPSMFAVRALQTISPVPVRLVPHVVEAPAADDRLRRADFEIPSSSYVFFYAFDLSSGIERKNPFGLIEAFRMAFRERDDVCLVLKYTGDDQAPAAAQMLRHMATSYRNIRALSGVMDPSAVGALFQLADCFVSPHRSEGFGLNIATAMVMAKPVICTAYSGNMDFTDESNSYGIRYKLTRLDEKAGPYLQNYAWAEPCVYHLSELLQEVHRERNEAIRKAEAGRERMLREFSVSAIGGVVSARLEEASSRS